MLKFISTSLLLILILLGDWGLKAQGFLKGLPINIPPEVIIIENYTAVGSHSNNTLFPTKKEFDYHNKETYLLPVTKEASTIFHILYQTDFSGKITFIGLSNNLLEWFLCEKKPIMSFDFCVKAIDADRFPNQYINEFIDCIMQRIQNCNPSS